MQRILEGLEGVKCQMDDILVFGKTNEQHYSRLEAVLKRLEEANVTLNIDKCEFAKEKVEFLAIWWVKKESKSTRPRQRP